MNKVVFAGLSAAVVGLGLFAGTSAHAQTLLPVQHPFRIKLGAAFGSSGELKSSFFAGASYDFNKTTSTSPTVYEAYLDYYGKDRFNVTGIGVAARFNLASAFASSQPYAGVGLGFYDTHVSGSGNKGNFGGKIFAGYQLNQGLFAEADYSVTSKNNGTNPNAFGLRLGYRF